MRGAIWLHASYYKHKYQNWELFLVLQLRISSFGFRIGLVWCDEYQKGYMYVIILCYMLFLSRVCHVLACKFISHLQKYFQSLTHDLACTCFLLACLTILINIVNSCFALSKGIGSMSIVATPIQVFGACFFFFLRIQGCD